MLDELKQKLNNCTNCPLHKTRNKLVFGDGSSNAKIMLIGEAPGADEDKTGIPFVGRAGKLLNELLIQAGIDRKTQLYIANTVKCRPPLNRKPALQEKIACAGNLKAQINKLKPKVIILCGATAFESFINEKNLKITSARGKVYEFENGIKLVPVFHPSYLLRKHSTEPDSPRGLTIKDFKMVKNMAGI